MTQYLDLRGNQFFALDGDNDGIVPHSELVFIGVEREYNATLQGVSRVDKIETFRIVVNIHSIDDLIKELEACKAAVEAELKKVVTCVLKSDSKEDK